jgi:hypothetical protein
MSSEFLIEQKNFPNYGYSISKFPDSILSKIKHLVYSFFTLDKNRISISEIYS